MATLPQSQLELRISARNLRKLHRLNTPFVQAVTFIFDLARKEWVQIGRSEVVELTTSGRDVEFKSGVLVDYIFGIGQKLKFTLIASSDAAQSQGRYLFGTLETSLGAIVGSHAHTLYTSIVNPRTQKPRTTSHIKITAIEVKGFRHSVHFKFGATGLDKKDLFGKSDPYYIIFRGESDGSFSPIYTSPHLRKTLDPSWVDTTLRLVHLCGPQSDLNTPLRIEVHDWDRVKDHDLIGQVLTTPAQLLSSVGQELDLINPTKQAKKSGYKNSGKFKVELFELVEYATFFEYIAGGVDFNLTIAIDFTASNGDPVNINSLHHRSQNGSLNQYQDAIQSIVSLLEPYDSDNRYPVYGFGAHPVRGKAVSHDFPLTYDAAHPEVSGIQGVLSAYSNALSKVVLNGPTNFAPIIESFTTRVRQMTADRPQGSHYSILLILTDGEVSDLQATLAAIVKGSGLPLSILIVGVGNADFGKMEILDPEEDVAVEHGGKKAERDNVSFVKLRDVKGRGGGGVATALLTRLPQHILQYMTIHKIQPAPPVQFTEPPTEADVDSDEEPTKTPVTPAPARIPAPVVAEPERAITPEPTPAPAPVPAHPHTAAVSNALARLIALNNEASASNYISSGWTLRPTEKGVIIQTKDSASGGVPIIRAEGLLKGEWTVEEVASVIFSENGRSGWDTRIDSTSALTYYTSNTSLVYTTHKGSLILSSRDYITVNTIVYDADVTYVIQTSVEDSYHGAQKGKVRGWITVSGWILQRVAGGVRIVYVEEIDVKGRVPGAIIKLFTTQNPLFVAYIIEYINSRGFIPYIISNSQYTSFEQLSVVSQLWEIKTYTYKLNLIIKKTATASADEFSIALPHTAFPAGAVITYPEGLTIARIRGSTVVSTSTILIKFTVPIEFVRNFAKIDISIVPGKSGIIANGAKVRTSLYDSWANGYRHAWSLWGRKGWEIIRTCEEIEGGKWEISGGDDENKCWSTEVEDRVVIKTKYDLEADVDDVVTLFTPEAFKSWDESIESVEILERVGRGEWVVRILRKGGEEVSGGCEILALVSIIVDSEKQITWVLVSSIETDKYTITTGRQRIDVVAAFGIRQAGSWVGSTITSYYAVKQTQTLTKTIITRIITYYIRTIVIIRTRYIIITYGGVARWTLIDNRLRVRKEAVSVESGETEVEFVVDVDQCKIGHAQSSDQTVSTTTSSSVTTLRNPVLEVTLSEKLFASGFDILLSSESISYFNFVLVTVRSTTTVRYILRIYLKEEVIRTLTVSILVVLIRIVRRVGAGRVITLNGEQGHVSESGSGSTVVQTTTTTNYTDTSAAAPTIHEEKDIKEGQASDMDYEHVSAADGVREDIESHRYDAEVKQSGEIVNKFETETCGEEENIEIAKTWKVENGVKIEAVVDAKWSLQEAACLIWGERRSEWDQTVQSIRVIERLNSDTTLILVRYVNQIEVLLLTWTYFDASTGSLYIISKSVDDTSVSVEEGWKRVHVLISVWKLVKVDGRLRLVIIEKGDASYLEIQTIVQTVTTFTKTITTNIITSQPFLIRYLPGFETTSKLRVTNTRYESTTKTYFLAFNLYSETGAILAVALPRSIYGHGATITYPSGIVRVERIADEALSGLAGAVDTGNSLVVKISVDGRSVAYGQGGYLAVEVQFVAREGGFASADGQTIEEVKEEEVFVDQWRETSASVISMPTSTVEGAVETATSSGVTSTIATATTTTTTTYTTEGSETIQTSESSDKIVLGKEVPIVETTITPGVPSHQVQVSEVVDTSISTVETTNESAKETAIVSQEVQFASASKQAFEAVLSAASERWEAKHEEDGVKVFTIESPDDGEVWVKTETVYEQEWKVEDVLAMISSDASRRTWDLSFEGSQVIRRFGQYQVIFRWLYNYAFASTKYEAVGVQDQIFDGQTNTTYLVATSIDNSSISATADHLRIVLLVWGWIIRPLPEGGIHVTHIVRQKVPGLTQEYLVKYFTTLITTIVTIRRYLITHGVPTTCVVPKHQEGVEVKVDQETFDTETGAYQVAYDLHFDEKWEEARTNSAGWLELNVDQRTYPEGYEVVIAEGADYVELITGEDGRIKLCPRYDLVTSISVVRIVVRIVRKVVREHEVGHVGATIVRVQQDVYRPLEGSLKTVETVDETEEVEEVTEIEPAAPKTEDVIQTTHVEANHPPTMALPAEHVREEISAQETVPGGSAPTQPYTDTAPGDAVHASYASLSTTETVEESEVTEEITEPIASEPAPLSGKGDETTIVTQPGRVTENTDEEHNADAEGQSSPLGTASSQTREPSYQGHVESQSASPSASADTYETVQTSEETVEIPVKPSQQPSTTGNSEKTVEEASASAPPVVETEAKYQEDGVPNSEMAAAETTEVATGQPKVITQAQPETSLNTAEEHIDVGSAHPQDSSVTVETVKVAEGAYDSLAGGDEVEISKGTVDTEDIAVHPADSTTTTTQEGTEGEDFTSHVTNVELAGVTAVAAAAATVGAAILTEKENISTTTTETITDTQQVSQEHIAVGLAGKTAEGVEVAFTESEPGTDGYMRVQYALSFASDCNKESAAGVDAGQVEISLGSIAEGADDIEVVLEEGSEYVDVVQCQNGKVVLRPRYESIVSVSVVTVIVRIIVRKIHHEFAYVEGTKVEVREGHGGHRETTVMETVATPVTEEMIESITTKTHTSDYNLSAVGEGETSSEHQLAEEVTAPAQETIVVADAERAQPSPVQQTGVNDYASASVPPVVAGQESETGAHYSAPEAISTSATAEVPAASDARGEETTEEHVVVESHEIHTPVETVVHQTEVSEEVGTPIETVVVVDARDHAATGTLQSENTISTEIPESTSVTSISETCEGGAPLTAIDFNTPTTTDGKKIIISLDRSRINVIILDVSVSTDETPGLPTRGELEHSAPVIEIVPVPVAADFPETPAIEQVDESTAQPYPFTVEEQKEVEEVLARTPDVDGNAPAGTAPVEYKEAGGEEIPKLSSEQNLVEEAPAVTMAVEEQEEGEKVPATKPDVSENAPVAITTVEEKEAREKVPTPIWEPNLVPVIPAVTTIVEEEDKVQEVRAPKSDVDANAPTATTTVEEEEAPSCESNPVAEIPAVTTTVEEEEKVEEVPAPLSESDVAAKARYDTTTVEEKEAGKEIPTPSPDQNLLAENPTVPTIVEEEKRVEEVPAPTSEPDIAVKAPDATTTIEQHEEVGELPSPTSHYGIDESAPTTKTAVEEQECVEQVPIPDSKHEVNEAAPASAAVIQEYVPSEGLPAASCESERVDQTTEGVNIQPQELPIISTTETALPTASGYTVQETTDLSATEAPSPQIEVREEPTYVVTQDQSPTPEHAVATAPISYSSADTLTQTDEPHVQSVQPEVDAAIPTPHPKSEIAPTREVPAVTETHQNETVASGAITTPDEVSATVPGAQAVSANAPSSSHESIPNSVHDGLPTTVQESSSADAGSALMVNEEPAPTGSYSPAVVAENEYSNLVPSVSQVSDSVGVVSDQQAVAEDVAIPVATKEESACHEKDGSVVDETGESVNILSNEEESLAPVHKPVPAVERNESQSVEPIVSETEEQLPAASSTVYETFAVPQLEGKSDATAEAAAAVDEALSVQDTAEDEVPASQAGELSKTPEAGVSDAPTVEVVSVQSEGAVTDQCPSVAETRPEEIPLPQNQTADGQQYETTLTETTEAPASCPTATSTVDSPMDCAPTAVPEISTTDTTTRDEVRPTDEISTPSQTETPLFETVTAVSGTVSELSLRPTEEVLQTSDTSAECLASEPAKSIEQTSDLPVTVTESSHPTDVVANPNAVTAVETSEPNSDNGATQTSNYTSTETYAEAVDQHPGEGEVQRDDKIGVPVTESDTSPNTTTLPTTSEQVIAGDATANISSLSPNPHAPLSTDTSNIVRESTPVQIIDGTVCEPAAVDNQPLTEANRTNVAAQSDASEVPPASEAQPAVQQPSTNIALEAPASADKEPVIIPETSYNIPAEVFVETEDKPLLSAPSDDISTVETRPVAEESLAAPENIEGYQQAGTSAYDVSETSVTEVSNQTTPAVPQELASEVPAQYDQTPIVDNDTSATTAPSTATIAPTIITSYDSVTVDQYPEIAEDNTEHTRSTSEAATFTPISSSDSSIHPEPPKCVDEIVEHVVETPAPAPSSTTSSVDDAYAPTPEVATEIGDHIVPAPNATPSYDDAAHNQSHDTIEHAIEAPIATPSYDSGTREREEIVEHVVEAPITTPSNTNGSYDQKETIIEEAAEAPITTPSNTSDSYDQKEATVEAPIATPLYESTTHDQSLEGFEQTVEPVIAPPTSISSYVDTIPSPSAEGEATVKTSSAVQTHGRDAHKLSEPTPIVGDVKTYTTKENGAPALVETQATEAMVEGTHGGDVMHRRDSVTVEHVGEAEPMDGVQIAMQQQAPSTSGGHYEQSSEGTVDLPKADTDGEGTSNISTTTGNEIENHLVTAVEDVKSTQSVIITEETVAYVQPQEQESLAAGDGVQAEIEYSNTEEFDGLEVPTDGYGAVILPDVGCLTYVDWCAHEGKLQTEETKQEFCSLVRPGYQEHPEYVAKYGFRTWRFFSIGGAVYVAGVGYLTFVDWLRHFNKVATVDTRQEFISQVQPNYGTETEYVTKYGNTQTNLPKLLGAVRLPGIGLANYKEWLTFHGKSADEQSKAEFEALVEEDFQTNEEFVAKYGSGMQWTTWKVVKAVLVKGLGFLTYKEWCQHYHKEESAATQKEFDSLVEPGFEKRPEYIAKFINIVPQQTSTSSTASQEAVFVAGIGFLTYEEWCSHFAKEVASVESELEFKSQAQTISVERTEYITTHVIEQVSEEPVLEDSHGWTYEGWLQHEGKAPSTAAEAEYRAALNDGNRKEGWFSKVGRYFRETVGGVQVPSVGSLSYEAWLKQENKVASAATLEEFQTYTHNYQAGPVNQSEHSQSSPPEIVTVTEVIEAPAEISTVTASTAYSSSTPELIAETIEHPTEGELIEAKDVEPSETPEDLRPSEHLHEQPIPTSVTSDQTTPDS
ncbi:Copine-8, partial [Rhizophlyctis rosea]